MFKRLVISLIAFSIAIQTYGQHRLSAGLHNGYAFSPQEELLEGINSQGRPLHLSTSADIQYAFITPGTSYQGLGVSVLSLYDHKDVGTPVSLYAFQGARIARLSPVLSIDYEWNFGASFGWRTVQENPFSTIMGTKVNAYVNASILFSWQPSDDWKISAGPDFSHYSNGHTGVPNAGLNTVGIRMNAARTFGKDIFNDSDSSWDATTSKGKIDCDITAFGAWHKYTLSYNDRYYTVDGVFGNAGIHITPFYNLHKHFRIGVSLDLNYSESANISNYVAGFTADDAIRFFHPPLSEQIAAGLSIRGELVMPIFSVDFGIGHNILYKGDAFKGLYQIIALKTHISRRLYIHTGYEFWNFIYPGNLLLGLGYRFGN